MFAFFMFMKLESISPNCISIEQVRRKIDSLRTYYREVKRREQTGKTTGSSGGTSTKKMWFFFERIDSFMRCTDYDPSLATSNMDSCFQEEVSKRIG